MSHKKTEGYETSTDSTPSWRPQVMKSERDKWEIKPRYRYQELLGVGSYGTVCKATDLIEKGDVAIKKIKKIFNDPIRAKRCYREMRILRRLQHPNVVALLDVLATNMGDVCVERKLSPLPSPPSPPLDSDLYLVFEFIDTDLQRIIQSDQMIPLEGQISFMLYQLLDGLSYVHRTNVIHRDLKPANVLVSCQDSTIKIADFGLARVVGEDVIAQPPLFESDVNGKSDGAASLSASSGGEGDLSKADSPFADDDVDPSSMTVPAASLAASGAVKRKAVTPAHAEIDDFDPSSLTIPAASLRTVNNDGEETFSRQLPITASLRDNDFLPPPPAQLHKNLTKHVVTRWYRAPEVILQQPYTTAVDIWSVGCIFAELLEMVLPRKKRKGPLFPGGSCGELSADDLIRSDGECTQKELLESYTKNRGQLKVIFDVIGTSSEEDLSYLDPRTAAMMRGLEKKEGVGLSNRFSFLRSTKAIDLLCSMLHFNPHSRISAAQALEHPFFDELRQEDYMTSYHELKAVPLDVDEEESTGDLETMIKKEVMNYRQRDRRSGRA